MVELDRIQEIVQHLDLVRVKTTLFHLVGHKLAGTNKDISLFFQSLAFLALEDTRCFSKLLSQIRECDLLYLLDCFRLLLYL